MLKSEKYQIWLLGQVLASLLFSFATACPGLEPQGMAPPSSQRTGVCTAPCFPGCVLPEVESGSHLFYRWGC